MLLECRLTEIDYLSVPTLVRGTQVAKTKRNGVSKSKIFRQYFADHPEWLSGSDNSPVLELFGSEHPEIGIDDSVKGVLANVKSVMRKAGGIKTSGGRRGRKAAVAKTVKAAPSSNSVLEGLEESIDTCMMTAKQVGVSGLDDVIKYLRRARNLVSLKLDQD